MIALRNLLPEESRQFLAASGVEQGLHDQIVDVSHGHPLGLSLLAEVAARGGDISVTTLDPDLVATAGAAWRHARQLGLPARGQAITQTRFIIDREAHQRASATVNIAPILTIQQWLETPNLPLGFITCAALIVGADGPASVMVGW